MSNPRLCSSPVLACFVVLSIPLGWTLQTPVEHSPGSRAKSSLELVVVVGRHGHRAPQYHYPKYPYPGSDRSIWPYGPGQLTQRGRVQMYQLGVAVRSLYDGFLSRLYHPEALKAYSTLVDRTLMSAQLFLAGLYPPSGFQVWNEDLTWQPIPVYPSKGDHSWYITGNKTYALGVCPKYGRAQLESLDRYDRVYGPNVTAFLQSIFPHTGMAPESTTFPLNTLWESLFNAADEGLPLPDWTASFYPEPLATSVRVEEIAYTLESYTQIRLMQGQLFQEVVRAMQATVDGSTRPGRLVYYSGHDHTVRGVRAILGLSLDSVPAGSVLLLELHRPTTGDHYVEVVSLDGSTSPQPVSEQVPGCGPPCLLTDLMSRTEKYYNITDFQAECQQP